MGHGSKPPGYYVQHSYGLFPAPWPQNSPDLPRVSQLMELLGMFAAKCIQDGRRVDLPLSAPFFKFMCMPGGTDMAHDGSQESVVEGGVVSSPSSPTPHNQPTLNQQQQQRADSLNDNADQHSNRTFDQLNNSNQRSGSRVHPTTTTTTTGVNDNSNGASRQRTQPGEAGLKEAELVLDTLVDEISKDGSPKEEVSVLEEEGGGWFEGVLRRGDLDEVNPYRSRFLKQLEVVVKQRNAIQGNSQLSSLEKERQLAGLTLPGLEENLPGARLEDLW